MVDQDELGWAQAPPKTDRRTHTIDRPPKTTGTGDGAGTLAPLPIAGEEQGGGRQKEQYREVLSSHSQAEYESESDKRQRELPL